MIITVHLRIIIMRASNQKDLVGGGRGESSQQLSRKICHEIWST